MVATRAAVVDSAGMAPYRGGASCACRGLMFGSAPDPMFQV
ncbi:hypothetical protein [Flexivirga caeni]|nr:hypothetical protein [Flexivirga caeni]